MRSMRQRLAAVTLLGGLTTLGIGLSAGPASAAINDCSGYVGNAQSGSLHLTSTPAAGSDVPAGSAIALQAAWNDSDFEEIGRFYVCGSVDGVFNAAMSSQDDGVSNLGTLAAASTLPASVPVGSDVCLVGVIKGQLAPDRTQGNMVSETLCYTSAAVATTTTTMAPTT